MYPHATLVDPVVASVGAALLIGAAIHQAGTARLRHEEQTNADLQRRITESFTKAVEQLRSDKLQVRLGGIYTLERIARESEVDYWPVMETLTALIRVRAPWMGEYVPWMEETVALSQAAGMRLHYRAHGEWVDYRVRLITIRPHYGWLLWWFVCPLTRQGDNPPRQVAKLYLPQGGRYFGSRAAYGLTYRSCQESGKFSGGSENWPRRWGRTRR